MWTPCDTQIWQRRPNSVSAPPDMGDAAHQFDYDLPLAIIQTFWHVSEPINVNEDSHGAPIGLNVVSGAVNVVRAS